MSNNANARQIIRSDCANAETDLDMRASIPAGNRLESGLLQSTNPTRQFSSHLFNDRGEVKNKSTKLLEVVFQK